MVHRLVLDNGCRVVAERMTSVRSVAIGAWLMVGSRYETAAEHGLSHFVEHMFFKGTRRRTAKALAEEIDHLGGEMNAFTTREQTAVYVKVLDADLPRAVEILSDVVHHSRFAEREIAREKQVVIEEIKQAEDDPEGHLYDLHLQAIWPADPLGRSILGTAESVSRFTRRDCLAFLARHYTPDRLVIAAAGNLEPRRLHRLVAKAFGRRPPQTRSGVAGSSTPLPPPARRGGLFQTRRPLEQVHLCVSLPGLPTAHPDRYALLLLSTLLGGGPSSRLFQEVREHRGLAYSIYSSTFSFADAGVFNIYAATRAAATAQVLRLTLREIRRVKRRGIEALELDRAKRQMRGHLMLGMESTGHRMSKLAQEELAFRRAFSADEILGAIRAVSRRQLHRLANDLLDERALAVSALGPLSRQTFGETLRKTLRAGGLAAA